MIQETAPNSSSVWIAVVQGGVVLGSIYLSHLLSGKRADKKAEEQTTAVKEIKDINVAQSAQLGTVERLVNGDRLKMKLHNAALEAQVRAAGLTPELPPE